MFRMSSINKFIYNFFVKHIRNMIFLFLMEKYRLVLSKNILKNFKDFKEQFRHCESTFPADVENFILFLSFDPLIKFWLWYRNNLTFFSPTKFHGKISAFLTEPDKDRLQNWNEIPPRFFWTGLMRRRSPKSQVVNSISCLSTVMTK